MVLCVSNNSVLLADICPPSEPLSLTVLKSGLCSHFYANQLISECFIQFSFRFVGRIYIDKDNEEPVVR